MSSPEHFGIKIVMNEEKILKEDIYDLEELYSVIDKIAEHSNMKKIDKYNFISKNDSPTDLSSFVWSNLSKQDWFMKNVKEFIWLDNEGTDDLIKLIEKYEKVA